ncbi:hypothetical protein EYZ11_005955 [Aspergillus tanneri]|uniref:5'-Nucleotidase C-terminal domain-containing protein n=1 Tax=Aspergillus tanneri TaxID=1220188 RepID=A0A4S3JGM0_9EURO|nr:uncharacterized protein ATNIH1004_002257 [Aspergillus tanneri]KAA8649586.1 hypothetical protein ATNIH1004_002257 [Aspergillus tanneri]THC94556.1 hypothetical protein EYZ11_005955 [Aspergillus tanneri]
MQTELRIVHFNDIYHLPSTDLLSRFTRIQQSFLGSIAGLTIFSGDAFSPSLEASVLKGAHMGPVLDYVGVDLACYGNHDFDFGNDRLVELSSHLRFPWVLSNAHHAGEKDRLLACAQESVTWTVDGVKIGFFGLAGTDWPSNCENLPLSTVLPPVETAQRLAHRLRTHEGCDVVIAVTHMRLAEDMQVMQATISGESRVDLLLGGHDHEVVRRYGHDTETKPEVIEQGRANEEIVYRGRVDSCRGDIRIVKSGTDWRGLSLVRMLVDKTDGVVSVSTQLTQYTDIQTAIEPISPAPEEKVMLTTIHDQVGALVQEPVLHCAVPLDGRSTVVRSQETNLGNMLADAVRAFYQTDIAFFNSGAIRCDRIIDQTVSGKPLLVRDIINICPFENTLLVKRISGKTLYQALENSISDMHTDGRFLQVSGLRIRATWQRQQGSRVLDVFLDRDDTRINPQGMYTVALAGFIAQGFDGYTWFPKEETLVGAEAAMTDTGLMLQVFEHGEPVQGNSVHDMGIERARRAVVSGRVDGFPVVSPVVDGRIQFVEIHIDGLDRH